MKIQRKEVKIARRLQKAILNNNNLSEPLDKQDPTEPVKVTGGREGKAINIIESNSTVL
jgi:hypothetical protein